MVIPHAFELAHDVEHAADQLRVERGGGFVKQHDLGLKRERARDRDPLLLAARKLARIGPAFVGKTDAIKRSKPTRSALGRAICEAL